MGGPLSERTAVVRRFVESFRTRDLDRIMLFFTDDCVYHNIPMDPVTGTSAIRAVLQGFMGMSTAVEFELLQIAENEAGVVLNERVDKFEIGGKWVAIPVMGAFELRDGKISAWRDYFDLAQFTKQLPGAPS
jgi:limonene-1,2-epoxide hydrolase